MSGNQLQGMEFRRISALRGPNLWASFPVLEVELDLGALADRASDEIPGFVDRLMAWLPGLIEHDCGVGGFLEQLKRRAYLAHVLEHVVLELQSISGTPVEFGRVGATAAPGVFNVVCEYQEEELARACLATGGSLILAAVHDSPFDAAGELSMLRDLANDVKLGPSTGAIVRAALARDIPFRRLNKGSLVLLGQGARARRILTAETDRTGAIAETVAQDKQLTRSLLKAVGAPVPVGHSVDSADDAWETAKDIGLPVVIKPQYGNHGRGVATNLSTEDQVRQAFAAAQKEGSAILVETFAPGHDHRLLVIGEKLVAAALREPAHVIGNGRSTITELVAEVNKDPRRSDGHATSLSFIKLDTVGLAVLGEQGFAPDSVPPSGQTVLIRRNGNLSTGGTATDVTDRVHPDVAARAIDAARVIGLDIAGVDVVALDIGRPLEEQKGAIVEVNAGPGLRMHLEPSAGQPRAVGEAIVSLLFPAHETGRIPTVAVTGVLGGTAVARRLARLLQTAGKTVGLSCSEGVFVNQRRVETRDGKGADSALAVLINPKVEAAVFETSHDAILREGLAFDRCDVAIVTDIGPTDSIPPREIEALKEMARVKRTIIETVSKQGFGILNADDPLVSAMAEHCPGSVVYFSRSADNPLVLAHVSSGGRAAFLRDGAAIFAKAAHEEKISLPVGTDDALQVLAATTAAWCLGVPLAAIA